MLIDILFYCILFIMYLLVEISRLALPIVAIYFFIHSNIFSGLVCIIAVILISIIFDIVEESLEVAQNDR